MEMQLIENRIIIVQEKQIILDSDIAELYGVETKRINEAVKNNPDKFPEGYIIYLTESDLADLRSKFSTAKFSKTRVAPKGFSEKGLYMLATILKSPVATETTIAIIETFAKVKELSRPYRKKPKTTGDKSKTSPSYSVDMRGFFFYIVFVESQEKDKKRQSS